MATNETIGDSATHFFKTGNILRRDDSALVRLREMLPASGPNDTRVEYDVWYDMGDKERIHGYVFTDALGQFVYLRVADTARSHEAMRVAAQADVTDEGVDLVSMIAEDAGDKYRLRQPTVAPEKVVFLPGTNLMEKAVDWRELDRMARDGWAFKCHPLTSRDLRVLLAKRFGESTLIDRKASGHALLRTAEKVACANNSEMGLVAIAKGKEFVNIAKRDHGFTYSAIYSALKGAADPKEALTRILSCKASGLIPVHASDPGARIQAFFDTYKDLPHVRPKAANP